MIKSIEKIYLTNNICENTNINKLNVSKKSLRDTINYFLNKYSIKKYR